MPTQYLDVPGGRIAYDDTGSGPLVLCVPGLGDVRASYRFLTPRLAAAGYRVVTMDLRGHGESSTGWPDYRSTAIASDVLALVRALGASPAVLLGNSFGGAVVTYAAALDPAAAANVVLIDAFVRDTKPTLIQRLGLQAISLLGVGAWAMYYKSLYPSVPPADLDTYIRSLTANLKQPGRYAATRAMLRGGTGATIEAALAAVRAPVLVMMGTKDPDFSDPTDEAQQIARRLTGAARVEVRLIADAGHYPHAEMPDAAAEAIVSFLATAEGRVQRGA